MIQDPATALSVDLLAPRPGEKVLDACAAPGGKTMLIAGRMQGGEGLTAMEYHADRLPALRDNLRRLEMEQVEVVHGDAREPRKRWVRGYLMLFCWMCLVLIAACCAVVVKRAGGSIKSESIKWLSYRPPSWMPVRVWFEWEVVLYTVPARLKQRK